MSAHSKMLTLYWSVRSPFCYLAMKRLKKLSSSMDFVIQLRPVLPLGIRDTSIHDAKNKKKHRYNIMDARRVADMLGLRFNFPEPDPLSTNPTTAEPYAVYLTNLCIAAERIGIGTTFAWNLSNILFSKKDHWPDNLWSATIGTDVSFEFIAKYLNDNAEQISEVLETNHRDLDDSGHWGVPLVVYDGEPFFGQDRIDVLRWRIQQEG